MTPNTKARELADRICNPWLRLNLPAKEFEDWKMEITILLSEAMEEKMVCVSKRGYSSIYKDMAPWIKKAEKDAYLKAAEIAKSYKCGDIRCRTGLAIAAAIEQMAKENK